MARSNSTNLTVPGEMLRLNTAIPAAPIAEQKDLGFLACDLAGFPNGRRPIDDVVDIELTVAEGAITAANPLKLQTCDVSGAVKKFIAFGQATSGRPRGRPGLGSRRAASAGRPLFAASGIVR